MSEKLTGAKKRASLTGRIDARMKYVRLNAVRSGASSTSFELIIAAFGWQKIQLDVQTRTVQLSIVARKFHMTILKIDYLVCAG